jgi:transposase InsO family protein
MKNGVDIKTAAKLLGKTERHLRRQCCLGQLPGAKRTQDGWMIPASADSRLSGVKSPQQLSFDVDLLDVPAHKRDEAIRRRGIIEKMEAFLAAACRNNIGRVEAMQRYANDVGVPVRTLQRWLADWRQRGIAGLIDSRGGQTFGEIISKAAWDAFQSMYLTQQRLSVKVCLNNISYIGKSEKKGWVIPTLRTMQRYVNEQIPYPVLVLHREGMAAYEAKCAPYVMVDQASVEPGAVWVGDHHQFNCWIQHRGQWVRPWITAWEDYRSRMILGWHISVNPNQTTILQAFKAGCQQYGPPESVKIDNGKDYDSELFTGQTKLERKRALNKGYIDEDTVAGIYAMLGVGVSFAIPYHPQSKKIERWFDTLDCQFTKTMPTYCGKDSNRKPDDLVAMLKTDAAKREAMTLETFAAAAGRYIEIYNRSTHTGTGMDGLTPIEVFSWRPSTRVVCKDTLDLLTQVWTGVQTVGKNGVKVKGLYYGQFNPELLAYQSKGVRVAYSPDDMRTVHIYDAITYKLITIAEQATLAPYGKVDEEMLRDAMQQKNRSRRIVKLAKPAGRVAAMSLADLTLEAMAAAADDRPATAAAAAAANIKPVRTPLDGQAKEHLRQRQQLTLRRAVGDGVNRRLEIEETIQTYQPRKLVMDESEPIQSKIRIFEDGHE